MSYFAGNFRVNDPWLDICPSVHGRGGVYHARISQAEIWRSKDSRLSCCPCPHSLCLYENFGNKLI